MWAFEPYPDNLRWLNSNVCANGHCETVEVIDAALGAEEGMSWIAGKRGGGNAAVGPTRNDYSRPTRMLRLDDLELPARMSFIKLDVEGYELEVLRGARQVIERDRPAISVSSILGGWLTGERILPPSSARCTPVGGKYRRSKVSVAAVGRSRTWLDSKRWRLLSRTLARTCCFNTRSHQGSRRDSLRRVRGPAQGLAAAASQAQPPVFTVTDDHARLRSRLCRHRGRQRRPPQRELRD